MKRTPLTSIIILMLSITPYYSCLTSGTFSQILFFTCLMADPCASIFAVIPVFITDIFPHSVRCSIANLIYSLAAVIGGGITSIIAIKLDEHHGHSPSYILIILGSLSLITLVLFIKKENQKINRLVLVD